MRKLYGGCLALLTVLLLAYVRIYMYSQKQPSLETNNDSPRPNVPAKSPRKLLQAIMAKPRSGAPAQHSPKVTTDREQVQSSAFRWAASAGFNFPIIPRLPDGYIVPKHQVSHNTTNMVPYSGKPFDVNDRRNVIVMLHIQKTAGTTLNRLLTERVISPSSCSCRVAKSKGTVKKLDWRHCKCFHPGQKRNISQWLYSRTTTGWGCGLHPGFTDFTECLSGGKIDAWDQHLAGAWSYFFITILRRPLDRYISEFAHIRRGATWKNAWFRCNGLKLYSSDMPLCFSGQQWSPTTSLAEFAACPYNMGTNRQTRMLANLSLVNCYDAKHTAQSKYNRRLLQSAKKNLASMAWFGLAEYMNESVELFEHRFGMQFSDQPLNYAGEGRVSKSSWVWKELTEKDLSIAREANFLDIQLYDFAKELFLKRYAEFRAKKKTIPELSS